MLSDVTVGITSFLRWGYLEQCLRSLRATIPECNVIVVDNSGIDPRINRACPDAIRMPFDSGLTVCRNVAVQATPTKYFLLGCDDFDYFNPRNYRSYLDKAIKILDEHPDIDIVGGRCNGARYEGFLSMGFQYIKETRLEVSDIPGNCPQDFYDCDITVNHFLARTSTLLECPWDERTVPIGGEHGEFFWNLKTHQKRVVYLPGWNIRCLRLGEGPEVQHERYRACRNRAWATGHTEMLEHLKIQRWVGFDEEI